MLNLKFLGNLNDALRIKKSRRMLIHPHDILESDCLDGMVDEVTENMPATVLRSLRSAIAITELIKRQMVESSEETRQELEDTETKLNDDLDHLDDLIQDIEDALNAAEDEVEDE